MLYVLIGIAVFVLLVWAGRRARPLLIKRELRIVSGALGSILMAAGATAAVTGRVLPGVALIAVGLGLAISGRFGVPRADKPAALADDPELSEARDILGVGPSASREEIQAAYGRLIRAVHPDAGGTSGLAARLNAARDALLRK